MFNELQLERPRWNGTNYDGSSMVNSVDSSIVDHSSLVQFLDNDCSSSTCSTGTEGSAGELPGDVLHSTACRIAIACPLLKVFGAEEDKTKWVSRNINL
jgi:hypothetical protein